MAEPGLHIMSVEVWLYIYVEVAKLTVKEREDGESINLRGMVLFRVR